MQVPNCYDYYFKISAARHCANQIDFRWFKAMGMAESNLNPEAVSAAGAIGVMQLMPLTASGMAERLDIADTPLVPHINISLGVAYAYKCWTIWNDEVGLERIRFMLGSYNTGPANIIDAQDLAAKQNLPTDKWAVITTLLAEITNIHAQETVTYVARVEEFYNRLKEA